MNWTDMIFRRKSVRSYTGEPVDEQTLDRIRHFIREAKPLDPSIRIEADIIPKSDARCILPWLTPQLIAIFSEEQEGWLENVGFVFQQVDLYLQSMGLGACWLGMGRLHSQELNTARSRDGMKYVIMLAFGHPKGTALRSGKEEFRRKAIMDISDLPDNRLEPARFAPSSVNSQPWRFMHEGDTIHACCVRTGLPRQLSDMNRIDMGIALAHLYAANTDSFRYFKQDVQPPKGCEYIGSFTL